MIASEHLEQARLFAWIKKHEKLYPDLSLIFAIPNGGYRNDTTAARIKVEGVRRGVPDIMVPIPTSDPTGKTIPGMFIEMKSESKSARLSPEQKEMIGRLSAVGYRTEVCHGCHEAKKAITQYLDMRLED
jgi:hypothetical protein